MRRGCGQAPGWKNTVATGVIDCNLTTSFSEVWQKDYVCAMSEECKRQFQGIRKRKAEWPEAGMGLGVRRGGRLGGG